MRVDVLPGVNEGRARAVERTVDAQSAARVVPRGASGDVVVVGRAVVGWRAHVEAPVGGHHIVLHVYDWHRQRRAGIHAEVPGRRGRRGQQGRGGHEDWAEGDHFFKRVCLGLEIKD